MERVTADLIRLFNASGQKVSSLVSLYGVGSPVVDYPEGLKIEVLNPRSKRKFKSVFVDFFKRERPDYFIFQGDNMTVSIAVLEAAKETGVIAIPQYHGSPYAYLRKYEDAQNKHRLRRLWSKVFYPFKRAKLSKFITASCHGLVCVSEGVRRELIDLFGDEKTNNLVTIYNPMRFSKELVAQKEKTVSFISRLESKHKNAFLIAKTWALISAKHPDWHLNIYGEGRLRKAIEEYFCGKGINNYEMKGFVESIGGELAKSSICLSTSNCEGFSMAVAEAILCGNAVVATDSDGGIKDMLLHNETALLSAKNEAKGLANHTIALIEDSALALKLREGAQARLLKIQNESPMVQWEKLLNQKRPE
ncbi:glycosyltransferase [Bergeyella sp. RCAD1439]|uniref:glycosyltransferase n=1 Tax=Bergeyella anatis TaxID=3113737 RepID=UPI002E18DC10|nr:glycosyltransferase [Bergeyella sp. RCAD1439]